MARPPATTPAITPVPRLSAPLAAIEQLRALIQEGALKPGDKLPPERQLAEMLGVSRPTAREALSALTLLNVVETRQGSGRVVSTLDLSTLRAPINVLLSLSLPTDRDVESILELRAVVESGLARMAATRMSDADLDRYGEILDRLRAATSSAQVLRHDMALHDLIAQASGSALLVWILESFQELSALARSKTIRVKGVGELVAADQERIYAALRRRDPAAAAEAMWAHLWRIEEAYVQREEPDPDHTTPPK